MNDTWIGLMVSFLMGAVWVWTLTHGWNFFREWLRVWRDEKNLAREVENNGKLAERQRSLYR